jgi:uncharacterized protein (UPF0332 family)
MNEIAGLFGRASRYLKSAGVLLAGEDAESAVSRTYYAMFYAAEAALPREVLRSRHTRASSPHSASTL